MSEEIPEKYTRGKYRISKQYRTVWKRNPISGHSWPEYEELKGWEVTGGWWGVSKHRKISKAIEEAELRESIDSKFPIHASWE